MSAEEVSTKMIHKLPFPENCKVFPLCTIGPKEELLAQLQPAFDWMYDMINNPVTLQQSSLSSDHEGAPTVVGKQPPDSEKIDISPRSPTVLSKKFEDWLTRSFIDVSPDEFLMQFNELRLPLWDHYTHIRLAFIILTKFGRQKGMSCSELSRS
jgi:hypothetical protein